jgi:hypothetical protein
MLGRLYTIPFTAVAVTAQQDFFEITAATGKPCQIHSIELEQSTEVGDAQEEGLSILLKRGTSATTSGTGGTTPTPATINSNDAAAGFTSDANNTTKMTGGTITSLRAWNWNVRMPFLKLFTPETRPYIVPGERLTLELATTPADSITISGTLVVEEL